MSIYEAIQLARTGNHDAAAQLIRAEFEKLQSPGRMVELCEWLAYCYESIDDYRQAGYWYESAGAFVLSDSGSQRDAMVMEAIREYEKAVLCYERLVAGAEEDEYDDDPLARSAEILDDLRHSYSAS